MTRRKRSSQIVILPYINYYIGTQNVFVVSVIVIHHSDSTTTYGAMLLLVIVIFNCIFLLVLGSVKTLTFFKSLHRFGVYDKLMFFCYILLVLQKKYSISSTSLVTTPVCFIMYLLFYLVFHYWLYNVCHQDIIINDQMYLLNSLVFSVFQLNINLQYVRHTLPLRHILYPFETLKTYYFSYE